MEEAAAAAEEEVRSSSSFTIGCFDAAARAAGETEPDPIRVRAVDASADAAFVADTLHPTLRFGRFRLWPRLHEAIARLRASAGRDAECAAVCERGALLHTADGWVVCNRGAAGDCALRLWAEGHPAPIELLRERMATLLSQHGLACRGRARCRLPTEFEATGRLLMSCETCGSNVVVV